MPVLVTDVVSLVVGFGVVVVEVNVGSVVLVVSVGAAAFAVVVESVELGVVLVAFRSAFVVEVCRNLPSGKALTSRAPTASSKRVVFKLLRIDES